MERTRELKSVVITSFSNRDVCARAPALDALMAQQVVQYGRTPEPLEF